MVEEITYERLPKFLLIADEKWKLVVDKNLNRRKPPLVGECRHTDKEIAVVPGLPGPALYQVLTHEILHACLPILNERAVLATEKSLFIMTAQLCGDQDTRKNIAKRLRQPLYRRRRSLRVGRSDRRPAAFKGILGVEHAR